MRKTGLREALFASALALLAVPAHGAPDETGSGLPVPRFVSLKADKVNVRNGPNRDQDVAWIFSRAGLPVEITAEFETWRRIRDSEGTEGWVYHSLLSGRRTALVAPWMKTGTVSLRDKPSTDADVVARLEHGVLGSLKNCDGQWCRFTGPGFDGFIEQNQLWGAYPNEKLD
ncbi:SH3 domain-containing protein [Aquabacter cavernae]|uniref:SH3 domain-containing protein n=1 Tax=Aquabacter cavernae TaxID=2496029 RepID=UPI000F8DC0EB|nr:SH3 domain-containing protein [Aquabacter cavernae]